jgi:hypothetical protein
MVFIPILRGQKGKYLYNRAIEAFMRAKCWGLKI